MVCLSVVVLFFEFATAYSGRKWGGDVDGGTLLACGPPLKLTIPKSQSSLIS